MIILHIDEQTTWRGGEQQAFWLMRGLRERGHTNLAAGRKGSPFLDHATAFCAATFELPFLGEIDPYTAWQLRRVTRLHQVDILHAHSSHAHMAACLARRFSRTTTKVVVTRRVSFLPKSNPFNRWKYREPDRLVAVSKKVADVLRQFGVRESRLATVSSAVDMSRVDVEPLPRATFNVPERVPLLFNAGALTPHKDHETLIRALARVRNSVPKIHLIIAGEGELRPQLEGLIITLGLAKEVTLLGHRDDVPALLRASDVYVSSSWSEGLGTSVLEALAAEVPVVAAEAGGIPEMVHNGVTGRLVPNRDPEALAQAILTTLRTPRQSAEMARAGRQLVAEAYSVDRMVEGNLAVYRSLFQTSQGGK